MSRDSTIARALSQHRSAHPIAAAAWDARDAEIARLRAIINTPHTDDFLQAVSIEAEHQRQRWGAEGDAGKTAADWFWLLGYLSGKALTAFIKGDRDKGLHHIISSAAALKNWHMNVTGEHTSMRPGVSTPDAAKTTGAKQ